MAGFQVTINGRFCVTAEVLGDHVRKRRLDLGLLQKQVAEQIGVDETTVCNWEGNTTTPVLRCIPRIIRFLGYNPYPPGQSLSERLSIARRVLGLSQRKLADMLSVDQGTLAGWESGRHRPRKTSAEAIEAFLRRGNSGT